MQYPGQKVNKRIRTNMIVTQLEICQEIFHLYRHELYCHQDRGTDGVSCATFPHLEGGQTMRSATPITLFLHTAPYTLESTDLS